MRRSFRVSVGCLSAILLTACSSFTWADAPTSGAQAERDERPAKGKFIRITRDEDEEPVALETAIVRYVPADGREGLVVDLISVSHFGEKAYYRRLNKQMKQYDALLYELVAPQGTRIPKGQSGGLIPGLMKSALKLESQLEQIDYTKPNFVHADLTPEEIGKKMDERGQSGLSLTLKVFAEAMEQQRVRERKEKDGTAPPQIGLLTLFDPNGPKKLKRSMAYEMEHMEELGGVGETLTTMLIADRNAAVIRVLNEQREQGKRKLGIFYGAAHMPDLEKRLTEELRLKRSSEEWLTAWNLK